MKSPPSRSRSTNTIIRGNRLHVWKALTPRAKHDERVALREGEPTIVVAGFVAGTVLALLLTSLLVLLLTFFLAVEGVALVLVAEGIFEGCVGHWR